MKPALKVEHDAAGGFYRVTAPDGWCFEQGSLHELISDYGMSDTTQAQARKDAEQDRALYQKLMEPCTDPDCDWCHEESE